MNFVGILGIVMKFLYNLCNNYGIAIILFTLFSKLVLLPVSIWVHKNSIKMVKMQPDINRIKINFYGDKDKIAEEESKLYKKEKYNPLASLIPLVIQIALLLGLVQVINHPLKYILNVPSDTINQMESIVIEKKNADKESSSLELEVVKAIKKDSDIEEFSKIQNEEQFIKDIKQLELSFAGFDLSWIATAEKGLSLLVPLIAGISALLLCIGQNKMNVLQAEQSNLNKYGMLVLSVGLSLYLGMFVPAGVALYWTASNLFAIIQQWLLNIFINPKKYVNYEELEATNKELEAFKQMDKKKRTKEEKKKEKQDYKKFFSIANKHLVFYSESNGFYKYYQGIIEYLLKNTNIVIHYITSDFHDAIFEMEKKYSNIKAYYIEEKKLITLMMKMDADVVVMTMPDLQNYHIKRSYVRKDIEYIYIPHGMDSLNLTMRTGSMDHYDTVFVTGKYQKEEALKTNELHHLENRKIMEWGYSLLDTMIEEYKKNKVKNKEKTILIAPSWQKDNIVDLCLEEVLNQLKDNDYKVIVRPHPQQVRHMKEKFEKMKEDYSDNKNIVIQTDFSSNDTVFKADLMITDWSAIAYEYAFTTNKPVIFIDTPMKIMNPDYQELDIEPFNIWARNEIGKVLKIEDISKISEMIEEIDKSNKEYSKKISKFVSDSVYNIGSSSEIGANYIIDTIQKKIKERKKKDEK